MIRGSPLPLLRIPGWDAKNRASAEAASTLRAGAGLALGLVSSGREDVVGDCWFGDERPSIVRESGRVDGGERQLRCTTGSWHTRTEAKPAGRGTARGGPCFFRHVCTLYRLACGGFVVVVGVGGAEGTRAGAEMLPMGDGERAMAQQRGPRDDRILVCSREGLHAASGAMRRQGRMLVRCRPCCRCCQRRGGCWVVAYFVCRYCEGCSSARCLSYPKGRQHKGMGRVLGSASTGSG